MKHERWLRTAPQSKTRMELWGSSYTNTICALGPQQFLDQIASSNHESCAKVVENSSQELHSCISRQYFDLGREKSSAIIDGWFAPEKLTKTDRWPFWCPDFFRGRIIRCQSGTPALRSSTSSHGRCASVWKTIPDSSPFEKWVLHGGTIPKRWVHYGVAGLPTWKTWFWSLEQMKIHSAAILMWTEEYQALNPYPCIGDASNTPNTREGN